MSAPPGLKPKKLVQIITNAPSTVAGAGGERPKKANLSNSDFRSLLERSKTRERVSHDDAEEEANEKELRNNRKAKKAASFARWQAKKAALTQQQAQIYRDRAAERREDANPDYKDTEEFQGDIDIEKSKYLGGDVEHTHLVKGLDYALLQKTKAALEKMEDQRLEKQYQDDRTRKEREAKQKDEEAAVKADEPRFITHLGRSIFEVINKPVHSTAKDRVNQFLPGRMTFEFELDENFANPLPTTLLQPKSDLPAADERLSGMVSGDIRKRLTKVMEYLGQGGPKKGNKDKKKKKKHGEGNNGVKMEDDEEGHSSGKEDENAVNQDDDDIFGDVGSSYIPADSTSALDVRVLAETVKRERNRRENSDEDTAQPTKTEDSGVARSHKPEIMQTMVEPKRPTRDFAAMPKREQDPNYVDEVYDDTFATRGAFVVDDDSDDEDMGTRDAGRVKKLVRPWSDKDAKWSKQALEASEEPKNAQLEQKMKDQKFEKQFMKIQQVMNDRNKGEKHKKPMDVEDERSQKRNRILLKTPAHA